MDHKSRLLFVTYAGPLPGNDGKRQRTFALLQALEAKYLVDCIIIDNVVDYEFALANYQSTKVKFHAYRLQPPSWREKFLKRIGFRFVRDRALTQYISSMLTRGNYKFIFCRYIDPVAQLPDTRIPVVCDLDDDFDELYSSKLKTTRNFLRRLRIRQIAWMNQFLFDRLIHRVDKLIAVKDKDVRGHSFVLPNLPFQMLYSHKGTFSSSSKFSILYVGKLSYQPNAEGLLWFLKEVWRPLQNVLPGISLSIVSSADAQLPELFSAINSARNLAFHIKVHSIAEFYATHSIVIAPVFQGGGSNIKIAEALFMGRPVVGTVFAERGFEDAKQSGFFFTCPDAQHFCTAIANLFDPSVELDTLQQRAYEWARERFDIQQWNEKLLAELEKIN